MAGSTEGGVELEAARTRGECLDDLACHHRQVPYLPFGAPLERAGRGDFAGRHFEWIAELLVAHVR
jgi:hypothetical protein